jgi:anionic cell wall polymer biosynthesis LytR-Cps2A-Psr (LCP) family protein
MKKLLIAVIVLSFFGFGPLTSLFKSGKVIDSKDSEGKQILTKLKDSTGNKQEQTFLVYEKGIGQASEPTDSAMLLKYDSSKDKMLVGTVPIPGHLLVEGEKNFDEIKEVIKENYDVDIDYCFVYDSSGIARVIDLIAPYGININPDTTHNREQKVFNGSDFLSYIESSGTHPIMADELFMSIKEELMKRLNSEELLTLAPTFVNEALKSIETDIGKGKLMELGLMVLSNPIKTIEPFEITAINEIVNKESGRY